MFLEGVVELVVGVWLVCVLVSGNVRNVTVLPRSGTGPSLANGPTELGSLGDRAPLPSRDGLDIALPTSDSAAPWL